LKDEKGYQRLTTIQIIEKLKAQKQKYLDLEVFVGEKFKAPMRLIANLLTDEQAQKRIKKKTDRGGKLGKDALEGSGLNLFVSNIEKDKCDAASIYELYRLRWQIELVFKAWKSIMNLHKIHTMNAIRLECLLWIKLLWVLLNWSILMFAQRFSKVELSFYKLSRIMLNRKAVLKTEILENAYLLKIWLNNLIQLSKIHSRKEYKKGSKSSDLFNLTFL
jgi:IS4 transposase